MYKVTLLQKNSEESYSYRDEMSFTFETMEAVAFFCEHAMVHGVKPVTAFISMVGEEDSANEGAGEVGNDGV